MPDCSHDHLSRKLMVSHTIYKCDECHRNFNPPTEFRITVSYPSAQATSGDASAKGATESYVEKEWGC